MHLGRVRMSSNFSKLHRSSFYLPLQRLHQSRERSALLHGSAGPAARFCCLGLLPEPLVFDGIEPTRCLLLVVFPSDSPHHQFLPAECSHRGTLHRQESRGRSSREEGLQRVKLPRLRRRDPSALMDWAGLGTQAVAGEEDEGGARVAAVE